MDLLEDILVVREIGEALEAGGKEVEKLAQAGKKKLSSNPVMKFLETASADLVATIKKDADLLLDKIDGAKHEAGHAAKPSTSPSSGA